eukprot:Hpha_TRINITY_DN16856_c0_g4::TRINITY_DN16856_c0_g4_i2::g.152355::m.152355
MSHGFGKGGIKKRRTPPPEEVDTDVSALVGEIADAHLAGLPWLNGNLPSSTRNNRSPKDDWPTEVGLVHRRDRLRDPLQLLANGRDKARQKTDILIHFLRILKSDGRLRRARVFNLIKEYNDSARLVQKLYASHTVRRGVKMQRILDTWVTQDAAEMKLLRERVHQMPFVPERQEIQRARITELTNTTVAERTAAIVHLYRQRMKVLVDELREYNDQEKEKRNQRVEELIAAGIPPEDIQAQPYLHPPAKPPTNNVIFTNLTEDTQAARGILVALKKVWQQQRVQQMRTGGHTAPEPTDAWSMLWLDYRPPASQNIQDKINKANATNGDEPSSPMTLSGSIVLGRRTSIRRESMPDTPGIQTLASGVFGAGGRRVSIASSDPASAQVMPLPRRKTASDLGELRIGSERHHSVFETDNTSATASHDADPDASHAVSAPLPGRTSRRNSVPVAKFSTPPLGPSRKNSLPAVQRRPAPLPVPTPPTATRGDPHQRERAMSLPIPPATKVLPQLVAATLSRRNSRTRRS